MQCNGWERFSSCDNRAIIVRKLCVSSWSFSFCITFLKFSSHFDDFASRRQDFFLPLCRRWQNHKICNVQKAHIVTCITCISGEFQIIDFTSRIRSDTYYFSDITKMVIDCNPRTFTRCFCPFYYVTSD